MNGAKVVLSIWLSLIAIASFWPALGHPAHKLSIGESDSVSVSDGKLVRQGQRFLVKGVALIAFVDPPSVITRDPTRLEAQQHFGPATLTAAKSWGANTIRFHLSQAELDPQSSVFTQAYIDRIVGAVRLARSNGFIVIVNIQDHDKSAARAAGEDNSEGMPSAGTLRAALELGQTFGRDRGVIIELFNEPALPVNATNWALWKNGGVDSETGKSIMGLQAIIDQVRAAGIGSVLAVDGLMYGKSFEGAPLLSDPTGQLFYAIHPYLPKDNTPTLWEARFGYLVDKGQPVVATEWSAQTGGNEHHIRWCKDDVALQVPGQLLAFLTAKKVGVIGWAFDLPGTIVTDYNGTPTTYAGKKCGDPNGGPGEALKVQFAKPAQ